MGIIISLYRSAFKIKEIMLYGTFIIVPLRAVLTYFIFIYTDNVLYFIGIEMFTSFVSLSLLFYFFNKNVFSIVFVEKDLDFKIDSEITSYAKKMYTISLVAFFAGQSLSLILSFMLPTIYIGVYSILLSISGVTLFLINNLNTIFAPAISKLFSENRISELETLFKKTTFIINLLAAPFIISIIIFSKDILYLYDDTGGLVKYAPYLYVIMFGRIFRLLVGGAGNILTMANLEKYELKLQFFKILFINILSILFISEYKLLAVVLLFVIFSLLTEVYRIIIINIKLNMHPFSKPLYLLVLISIPLLYIGMTHELDFKIFHYFLIPILLYCFYALIFFKEIKNIYLDFRS
jgi:O-antigen/teichoic acid export membrane protein